VQRYYRAILYNEITMIMEVAIINGR